MLFTTTNIVFFILDLIDRKPTNTDLALNQAVEKKKIYFEIYVILVFLLVL